MKKYSKIGVICGLLLNLLILAGFTQEEGAGSAAAPVRQELKEVPTPEPEPPFIYQSGNRRDPFKPLVSQKAVGREIESPGEVEIVSLSLSGLIWDDGEVLALLHDGGNFGYILKKGRLLAANYRIIEGISGVIKADGVYLTQGKTKVKLTLREEEK